MNWSRAALLSGWVAAMMGGMCYGEGRKVEM